MTAATINRPITQGVSRYPIGLPMDAPTLRWYAEIVMPESDIAPDGRRVDSTALIVVGDIETDPEYGPAPGSRELAQKLAGGIAIPLGFIVGAVFPEDLVGLVASATDDDRGSGRVE